LTKPDSSVIVKGLGARSPEAFGKGVSAPQAEPDADGQASLGESRLKADQQAKGRGVKQRHFGLTRAIGAAGLFCPNE
jgi:hypothetical protein